MTGFGAAALQRKGVMVRTEIRSVNHRHLLVKSRFPAEYQQLEADVEGILRKKLQRGSVTVSVNIERAGGEPVRLDADLARRYREGIEALGRELELPGTLELSDLIQLPGILGGRDEASADSQVVKLILKSVSAAADELVAMRAREGEALGADLEKSAKALERTLERIVRRMPQVVRAHHQNLKRRLRDLLGGSVPLSEADLAREIALLSDKLDVGEETTRVAAHLQQLRELLEKGGVVGRKLDFLAQELFREANTIGSKCNDARVAHQVVELKSHIERLREQVQNVE